jgi:FkbM family methyltransferase
MKKIDLLVYKIAFKLNRLLSRIKNRFDPYKKNTTSKSKKNDYEVIKDGYHLYPLLDKQIIAPFPDCYTSLYKPVFEREIYGFKTEKKNPLIIDCGSNIGMGIIYWKQKYPNANIIAFEPSKKVFEALVKNIKTFELSDVQAINAAVSDSEGYRNFTVNEGLSGSLFLEKDLGSNYTVKTVLLEKYLDQEVDFLKVDIEGEEINIFPQIIKYLQNIHNLFIEYHAFVKDKQQLSWFLEVLEKHDFRYYIEGEYSHKAPLVDNHVHFEQDLQVGIWAKRINR